MTQDLYRQMQQFLTLKSADESQISVLLATKELNPGALRSGQCHGSGFRRGFG